MNTRIDVAQQKRRLILSPFLVAFFGALGYATAPTPLIFGIGMGVALSCSAGHCADRLE